MKTLKNTFRILLVAIIATSVISCNSAKITTDLDSDFEFANISTYDITLDGDSVMTSIQKARLEKAIDKQFEKRGIEKSVNPDLIVIVGGQTREKADVSVNHSSYGTGYGGYGRYRYGYGGMGYTTGHSSVNVNEYTEGTVFITMYEARTGKLVWTGTASGVMKEKNSQRDVSVDKAMTKVFKSFPVAEIKS